MTDTETLQLLLEAALTIEHAYLDPNFRPDEIDHLLNKIHDRVTLEIAKHTYEDRVEFDSWIEDVRRANIV